MYPSSSSSSSQSSMGPSGLIRYDSAPGSFLSNAVESAVGGSQSHHRHFVSHADTSEPVLGVGIGDGAPLQRPPPYYQNEMSIGVGAGSGGGGTSSLVRHSSSPAGFLNQLASCSTNNGFPITRGIGNFNTKSIQENGNSSSNGRGISRLNSQLSFTRQESSLSHISEEERDETTNDRRKPTTDSYNGTSNFGVGTSWEDSGTIVFSHPNKRSKNNINEDIMNSMESQLQFGLTQGGMEIVGMDKLLNINNIPQDSVPCKIRASRGCATHPRSIAERERRMRISGKLKKLQELVPNMDKQTSYSDMLDLAVQHIKGLQTQVEKLQHDMENCTCGCK
ncbi:transcription factor bHLH128-like [Impatiens glandulifera]|uniref:transcription factor bHLH128-like n=1 Tax=Impatiens glandulifera TaxID=253017 RepID=UPI001FB181C7|nr:transcription factor bHLH128-like [Impatiens glandulifera]